MCVKKVVDKESNITFSSFQVLIVSYKTMVKANKHFYFTCLHARANF